MSNCIYASAQDSKKSYTTIINWVHTQSYYEGAILKIQA